MNTWLTEIDLTWSGPPISMGIKKLGERPWIFQDSNFANELAHKVQLAKNPQTNVFMASPHTEKAAEQVISLLEQTGISISDRGNHPLERAGMSVQEDLCLVKRYSDEWILEAASLSFPSRWRLADKIGKNMAAVHDPVDKYQDILKGKVNTFFDRLGTDPVWRRNWFIHPDNSLYQPDRPISGDPIIPSAEVHEKLFVRSERQTLRALDLPDWILFTIRIQQTPLIDLIFARGEEFSQWLREAPESHHRQKGLQSDQVIEILSAIS